MSLKNTESNQLEKAEIIYNLNDFYVVGDSLENLHLCRASILDDYNLLGTKTRVAYYEVAGAFNAIYQIGTPVQSLGEVLTFCGINHIGYSTKDELEDLWEKVRMHLTNEVNVAKR